MLIAPDRPERRTLYVFLISVERRAEKLESSKPLKADKRRAARRGFAILCEPPLPREEGGPRITAARNVEQSSSFAGDVFTLLLPPPPGPIICRPDSEGGIDKLSPRHFPRRAAPRDFSMDPPERTARAFHATLKRIVAGSRADYILPIVRRRPRGIARSITRCLLPPSIRDSSPVTRKKGLSGPPPPSPSRFRSGRTRPGSVPISGPARTRRRPPRNPFARREDGVIQRGRNSPPLPAWFTQSVLLSINSRGA